MMFPPTVCIFAFVLITVLRCIVNVRKGADSTVYNKLFDAAIFLPTSVECSRIFLYALEGPSVIEFTLHLLVLHITHNNDVLREHGGFIIFKCHFSCWSISQRWLTDLWL